MTKRYNRVSVSLSNEAYSKLQTIYQNRKYNQMTKSGIIDWVICYCYDELQHEFCKKDKGDVK